MSGTPMVAFGRRTSLAWALSVAPLLVPLPAIGGGYLVDRSGVTYPSGYTGAGPGTLDVKVCLATSVPASDVARIGRPIRNAMARWNKGQPTTANVRDRFLPGGSDFESVALHELGHCVGLSHANVGGGVSGAAINSTRSSAGADGRLNLDPGADGIYGSADDVRADDVNRYYFRRGINDPFSMPDIVDATTYTTDLAALPAGDLFPANSERRVGDLLGVPFTEATMQHDIFVREISRTPSHDDVSTIRFAESGFDGRQGTADDYDLNLVWGGRSDDADCDITVEFSALTSFASCSVSFSSNGRPGSSTLIDGTIQFAPEDEVTWYFNQSPPCTASDELVANEWRQVSLPCEVGVSTSATVRSVLADDLGEGGYKRDWGVFVYEYAPDAGGTPVGRYRTLELEDDMESGVGYWVISTRDATITVSGAYHAQIDVPVFSEGGRGGGWNMIGNPFRYPTAWADTAVIDRRGAALGLAAADPGSNAPGDTLCTGSRVPPPECTLARFAFRYDGSADGYTILSPLAGSLGPFEAAWVFAGADDIEVRVAMPPTERTTP